MSELETQNAELIEQINSLQKAYGRMVDDNAEEKRELRTQLAKANERVAELEAAIATAIDTFNKYEMDVDTYPTIEHVKMKNGLHECLNKFAIEKKIEGYVKGFIRGYEQCKDDTESGNWTDDEESLFDYARDFSEQLRKEQDE